jgi:hypothetical protein
MKRKIYYLLSFSVLLLITSCGPTVQDAIDYNDKIIAIETSVIEKINKLESEFTSYDPIKIEPAWNDAKAQLETSITELEKVEAFDGKTEFKDQTMELFKTFQKQVGTEYLEMLNIYKLPADKYTEIEENRYNELLKKIDNEYQAAFNKFTDVQNKFAAKYGFELKAVE